MGVFVLSKDNKQLGNENSKDLNTELEQIKDMFEAELNGSENKEESGQLKQMSNDEIEKLLSQNDVNEELLIQDLNDIEAICSDEEDSTKSEGENSEANSEEIDEDMLCENCGKNAKSTLFALTLPRAY